jgi:hypothetical protein
VIVLALHSVAILIGHMLSACVQWPRPPPMEPQRPEASGLTEATDLTLNCDTELNGAWLRCKSGPSPSL